MSSKLQIFFSVALAILSSSAFSQANIRGKAATAASGQQPRQQEKPVELDLLGEDYLIRVAFDTLSGVYSDKETDESVGHEGEINDLKFSGKRVVIEMFPRIGLLENDAPEGRELNPEDRRYGLVHVELRSEATRIDCLNSCIKYSFSLPLKALMRSQIKQLSVITTPGTFVKELRNVKSSVST